MKRIKLLCAAGLLGTLAMTSCTDLTEKVYSDLVRDNYYTDKIVCRSCRGPLFRT